MSVTLSDSKIADIAEQIRSAREAADRFAHEQGNLRLMHAHFIGALSVILGNEIDPRLRRAILPLMEEDAK